MHIRILLLVSILSGITILKAQNYLPVFGKQIVIDNKNPSASSAFDITSDSDGNIYIMQDFDNNYQVGKDIYKSKTQNSTLILKFNNKGQRLWTLPWTNNAHHFFTHQIENVNVSTNIVSGYYYGLFKVNDTIVLDSFEDTWGGMSRNVYMISFDSSSHIIWAKGFNSIINIRMTISPNSNIWCLIEANNDYDTNEVFDTVFSNKYNAIASISATGQRNNFFITSDKVKGIAIDKDEDVFVTANLNRSDKTVLDTFHLKGTTSDRNDLFLAKYNSSDRVEWVKQIKSYINSYILYSRNMVCDNRNNIYLLFDFTDSMQIGDSTIYGLEGSRKLALAKFSSTGQLRWIKITQSNTEGYNERASEILLRNDKIYILAQMQPNSVWDGFTFPLIETGQNAEIIMDTNGQIERVRLMKMKYAYSTYGPGMSYYQYADLHANPLTFVKGWEFKPVSNADYLLIKVDTLTWWVSSNSTLPGKVNIRPNPVSEQLWLNVPQKVLAHAEVYDLQGKQMKSLDFNNPANTSIEVASLPKGMYLLTVTDKSGQSYFAKFVKQ